MPVLDNCCTNAFCASTEHRKKIDIYVDKLTSIFQNCRVMKTIRKSGFQAKSFWNNNLSGLKKNSLYAHKLWISSGKPKQGPVWELFKKGKGLYKLEIKKAKTELEHRKGQLMKNLLNKNNTKSFWNEWKKIIKKRQENIIDIEGMGNSKPCENFANYF